MSNPLATILQDVDLRTQRTLVLGATGQLGRHLVRELSDRGWPTRALRRWQSEPLSPALVGVEEVVGDIFDPVALAQALSGVNYVFYCVAPDADTEPGTIMGRAVEGIRRVFEAGRGAGVDRFVVVSCAATVARVPPGSYADERGHYLPGSGNDLFLESKYAVEQECYRYFADGMDIVMLLPTLLVGPGIDLTPFAALEVPEGQGLNCVDVRQVAFAAAQALRYGRSGERYIIGGKNATAGELFEGWRPKRRGRRPRRGPRDQAIVVRGQWYSSARAHHDLHLGERASPPDATVDQDLQV
ncbi:NAD-dependent epimerase/dehydratase family protein [Lujinxingia litoralis]|uniref:NAD-dependent epimerase/dehydratase family protein n=1 Tax=Lujinxingia litoralis TaxID=2211119 RepID=UPI001314CB11|nr:NAD-dependent epimerase/dehydratase family protein [Lujinxingia litoralis]